MIMIMNYFALEQLIVWQFDIPAQKICSYHVNNAWSSSVQIIRYLLG